MRCQYATTLSKRRGATANNDLCHTKMVSFEFLVKVVYRSKQEYIVEILFSV